MLGTLIRKGWAAWIQRLVQLWEVDGEAKATVATFRKFGNVGPHRELCH